MPDLLLELFSEEIPARMQTIAAADLKKLITDSLVNHGLKFEGAKEFSTPRRIALCVVGIPISTPASVEERKGPRVDAPEQAINGFLGAAGLKSIKDAQIKSDPKKGDYYVAVTEKPSQETGEILLEFIPQVIRKFSWPKSMKWGTTKMQWVRPLHSVLCTFGPETEETQTIKFDLDDIPVGNSTQGHRFMSKGKFNIRRFSDYVEKLEKSCVILDPNRRKDIILHDARTLATAQGLELVEDEDLLQEVTGLVEWPVVLLGRFENSYLDLPDEVIKTTIRKNQKCFVLRKTDSKKLANQFVMVSNINANDSGKAIIAGNERVISARLADAQFFWNLDFKIPLESRLSDLKNIVFHEKLGTVADRVKRINQLAQILTKFTNADSKSVERSVNLIKNDLVTEMVKEFPELQGVMGSYYAQMQGEDKAVCDAIKDHYKPLGPNDKIPTDPVSITLALAEKFEILTGFWAIGEKPTGSKDPYALRRAALGIVAIILENNLRIPIREIAKAGFGLFHQDSGLKNGQNEIADDLMLFFIERLKVQLRERGGHFDYIDAVFALEGKDDLVDIVNRIEALEQFLTGEVGAKLLAGYKRAVNILQMEEKKDGITIEGQPVGSLNTEVAESILVNKLETVQSELNHLVKKEQYVQAMMVLGSLKEPIDEFFEGVLVNDENPKIRLNRLKILSQIRNVMVTVADFSKIAGESSE